MAKPPRRRMTAASRRQVILMAAEQVFAAQGFAGASMEQIAAAAGVSKPVLYDHFSSKDALYGALVLSVRDTLAARGAAAVDRFDAEAAVDGFLGFFAERPAAAKVFFILPRSEAAAGRIARPLQQEARQGIEAMLQPRMGAAPEWQVGLLAAIIQDVLHAAAVWWLDNGAIPRAEIVGALSAFLAAGFNAVTKRARCEDAPDAEPPPATRPAAGEP